MENIVESNVIETILKLYGFSGTITDQKAYIHVIEEDGWMKLIFRVALEAGQRLVLKILHEDEDLCAEMEKVENQSIFSEQMRNSGIRTPKRYQANGRYCNQFVYDDLPCLITVEDWCGEEITEINTEIAYQIGELMARMHTLSLERNCRIGHRSLFSAAYWNDVDAFPDFCEITNNESLDRETVSKIKALREENLNRLRNLWGSLPKAAVQGDISINNLVSTDDGLIIFDYNNAGDEVLVSDLVMEGLLTAYEMDLPPNAPETYTAQLFSAFLKGYLSVRPLSEPECAAAWDIYTLYNGLWFTRIVYRDSSLDALVKENHYEAANRLLTKMLSDMEEADDGRFKGQNNGKEAMIDQTGEKVILCPMTRAMCHEFYRGFRNDPAIGHYYEYVYTPDTADRYFDTNTVSDRRLFAILAEGQIVGECKLKHIDMEKRECSMGIHLRDDSVKGKGYGTQAERLILKYAFEELGMVAVNADAVLKNTRSQHVLEKVGFRYISEDDTFKYYRCEKNTRL